MRFQAEIDENAAQHAPEEEKRGNLEHPEGMAADALIHFDAEIGRETRGMRNETVAGHEAADVEDARLKRHRHPDGDVASAVLGNGLVAVEHVAPNSRGREPSAVRWPTRFPSRLSGASVLVERYLL